MLQENAYSYVDGTRVQQEDGYLAWVGHLGAELKGNPRAEADPDHPAVLNLVRRVTFSYP